MTEPDAVPNPEGQDSSPDTPASTVEAPAGPEYVYGANDNVAEWQKYKTREELASITEQLYQTAMNSYNPGPYGQPQQMATPQPQQPVQQPVQLPGDEDWQLRPAQAADQLRAQTQQDLQPQFEQQARQMASLSRMVAESRDPDAFKRWGPEIDMTLNSIPLGQRTPELIEQAVQLVRGRHAREISDQELNSRVEQEIQRRQAAGLVRSTGGGDIPSQVQQNTLDLNDEGIPQKYREQFAASRVNDRVLDQFLLKKYPGIPLEAARKKYGALLKKVEVKDDAE